MRLLEEAKAMTRLYCQALAHADIRSVVLNDRGSPILTLRYHLTVFF